MNNTELILLLIVIVCYLLPVILIIRSMIVNAKKHNVVGHWINWLCNEIKTDNNTKYEKINKTLSSYFDSVKSRETTIINSLNDLTNDIQILKKNISTTDTNVNRVIDIQKDSYSKLNSFINELLSNDTQLKQKSDTINNNFTKYSSELQQKLDYLQKEQKENWSQLKYLQSFKDEVVENTIVCKQIQKTVSDIEKQEQILNGMIKQHTSIADYSKEIFETQESIVNLLKALMLDSLEKEVDNIKK